MNIIKENIKYKIKKKIPRFVSNQKYTSNFGLQWKVFRKTQIDKKGVNISEIRFKKQTGWKKNSLKKSETILEAGSGAGRFTKAFLDNYSGKLYSVDLSDAVESNYKNNQKYIKKKRLFLLQSDISNLPFKNNSFNKTFCFGVLQHTPNIEKTIKELVSKTKIGGTIVLDFYPYKGFWTKVNAKYILRPIAKRLSQKYLLKLIIKYSKFFYNIYKILDKSGLGVMARFLPICDPKTIPYNLKYQEKVDWIILDTFDMFSAYHDQPQKIINVVKMLKKFKCKIVFADYVNYTYGVSPVVRAIKEK